MAEAPPSPEKVSDKIVNARTREQLRGLGTEIAQYFVKDRQTEKNGEVLKGKLFFHGQKKWELSIGLRNVLPEEFTYVRVKSPDGKIVRAGNRRSNGNFYDEKGYIAVWDGWEFTAYKTQPSTSAVAGRRPPEPRVTASASPPVLSAPEPVPLQSMEIPQARLERTVCFGDSITRAALHASSLRGSFKPVHTGKGSFEIGAAVIGQGVRRMREALKRARDRGELAGIERIVMGPSVNDIGKKTETIKSIIRDMVSIAHNLGISVVLHTMAYWDPKKQFPNNLVRQEQAQRATNELNEWILQEARHLPGVVGVIDIYRETASQPYRVTESGIHFVGDGNRRIGEFIRREARLT